MRVIHLIPKDGLGGVEQAARSLDPDLNNNVTVSFMSGTSLSNKKNIKCISPDKGINSFLIFFRALLFLQKEKPAMLVCSLWRASIVGMLYKFLSKDVTLVVFIHNTSYKNAFDKIITRSALCLSDYIWCDSNASYCFLKHEKLKKKAKTISFFIKEEMKTRNDVVLQKNNRNFIYWGRLAPQKNIGQSIDIFMKFHYHYPDAKFFLYGVDSGSLSYLKEKINSYQAGQIVLFMGPKEVEEYPPETFSCSFFINSSYNEGMAISVVEAMQAGLIPLVTPVGEISNYCVDNQNALFIDTDNPDEVVARLVKVAKSEESMSSLRSAAIATWKEAYSYNESFHDACSEVFNDMVLSQC